MSNFRPLLAIAVFSCLPASLYARDTDNHSDSAAATLRQYDVEPTTTGVLGVLRQWRPDAENRARIARLVRDLGDDRWGVREAASRQLAELGTLAEAALREALKSNDAEVVFRARTLVAAFRQGRAEEVLSAALEWLRQSPTPQATPLLLDLLAVLPESFQSPSRDALWVCAAQENVPRLRQAIADARPALREAAIVALERAVGAGAVPELEPLLRVKSEATRLAAARALLDRLPRPSIAALLDLLDAREPNIRAQATWLLEQVSGIPGNGDPPTDLAAASQRWKAWAATEAAGHPQPLGPKRLQICGFAQQALRFDGQPGSYVDIPNLDMSCLTFATWIKRDVTGEKQDLIMSARMGGWGVFVSDAPRNSNDYLWFTQRGVGQWRSEASIADKQWHFAAITLENNSLKFYVDGKPAGSAAMGSAINNGGAGYWLGSEGKDNPGQSCAFQGRLRETLIFNRALRPAEIAQLYERGRSTRSAMTEGLVAGYHLDEGKGTTANDFSGHGNTGTFRGGVTWGSR